MRESGISVLLTDHNVRETLSVTDRSYIIFDGRVLRDGTELDLAVATVELDTRGTGRALVWAGALLQATPLVVRSQRSSPSHGVYVTARRFGSPVVR